jgi:hypothetical protein
MAGDPHQVSMVDAMPLRATPNCNRGETLASLRSLLQLGNPSNERAQGLTWIDIRYRDGWTWRTLLPAGSAHAHGLYNLACFMKKSAFG